jgi:hypothetical protein
MKKNELSVAKGSPTKSFCHHNQNSAFFFRLRRSVAWVRNSVSNAQSLPRWQVRNNAPQHATGKADGKGGNPSFGKSFVGFGLEEGCPTL